MLVDATARRLFSVCFLFVVFCPCLAAQVPTPIYPVGAIADRDAPTFRWSAVPDAIDYQVRFQSPETGEHPPVPPHSKCPDFTAHPALDFVYFVAQTNNTTSLQLPAGSKGAAWCALPGAKNTLGWPACHPLRTFTGCVPGSLSLPTSESASGKVCQYQFEWNPNPKVRQVPVFPHPDWGQQRPIYWITRRTNCAGEPFVYKWSIRAVFQDGEDALRYGKWSPFAEFWYDPTGALLNPAPVPPSPPPPNPGKPHPVTFVNASGKTLYIFYDIGTGGSVYCKKYTNAGRFDPGTK